MFENTFWLDQVLLVRVGEPHDAAVVVVLTGGDNEILMMMMMMMIRIIVD